MIKLSEKAKAGLLAAGTLAEPEKIHEYETDKGIMYMLSGKYEKYDLTESELIELLEDISEQTNIQDNKKYSVIGTNQKTGDPNYITWGLTEENETLTGAEIKELADAWNMSQYEISQQIIEE